MKQGEFSRSPLGGGRPVTEARSVALNLTARELVFLQKVTRQEYHFITDDEQQARIVGAGREERSLEHGDDGSVPDLGDACLFEGLHERRVDLLAQRDVPLQAVVLECEVR